MSKIGNFPEEKKPTLITPQNAFVLPASGKPLGTPYFSNLSHLYISTDKLHVGVFTVAPGSKYEPASVHIGDEVYYIIEGTLTHFNPESGQTTEAHAGDVIFNPRGCWHIGFNFTNKECVIFYAIAPEIYGKGVEHPPSFPGAYKFYKTE